MTTALKAKPGSRKRLKKPGVTGMALHSGRQRRAAAACLLAPLPFAARGAAAAVRGAAPGPAAHDPAARRASRFAVLQGLHAVDPHVLDARRQLVWLIIRRVILDRLRI